MSAFNRQTPGPTSTDLRLIEKIAGIGLWSFDPEVGAPQWSDQVYRIYERDPKLGPYSLAEYRSVYQGEEFDRFHQVITNAIEHGEPYDIELKLRMSDGRVKWIHALCEPEPEPGPKGHVLHGTIQEITRQKRITADLKHRSRLERLIAELSSQFVGVSYEQTDAAIHDGLRTIGQFTDADRAYVFLFHDDDRLMSNTHEWCAPGVEPQIQNLQNLRCDSLPWWTSQIMSGQMIYAASLDELPPDVAVREALAEQDIESIIVVPMIIGDRVLGYLGFDSVKKSRSWSDQEQVLLRVAGQAIMNLLERRRAHHAIVASHRRFSAILDNMSGIPVQGYDRQRRVIFWNAASERLYGHTKDQAMGQKLEDLIIPQPMRESVVERIETWLKGGPAIPAEQVTLVDRDGNDVPVFSSHLLHEDVDGNPQLYCMDVDLRELHQMQRQRDRLALAVEQVSDSVVITNPDGVIEYVNPAFEKLTGYPASVAIGQTPRLIKSGQHDQAFYKELWQQICSGQTWKGRMVNRRKDGSFFTEEAVITPIRDVHGQIVHFVGVKRDVTKQDQLEQQLQQSQKLEAVGRLAGGVAHDFNNMLTVILGHVQMAQVQTDLSPLLREGLDQIETAARRSADLTRQLLAFARRQSTTPQVIDVNQAIDTTLRMLRRVITEGITLTWEPGDELWPVRIDPGQFEQVITNLCINARDAVAHQGRITIRTQTASFGRHAIAEHPACLPGQFVHVSISDDGHGMDARTKAHIFEPFFTTKPLGQGTGLGLATVYGIVKQNGGFITVDSEPEQGTCFDVYLPKHHEPVDEDDTPAEPADEAADETVLYVEDEPAVLDLTRQMLEQMGYRVIAADSPQRALELAREHGRSIDLLFADVMMPGMDGRELCQRIRQIHPEIRCLFTSGYPTEIVAKQGVIPAHVHFIAKPFSKHALALGLRRALTTPS